MRIVPISSVPRHADPLARLHFAEWGELLPWWSLDAARDELAEHARSGLAYPTTFVAVDNDSASSLVGSVSLLDDDLPEYPHLRPWLASLYVLEGWRGRGLGRLLASTCVHAARTHGFTECHLFTSGQEGFYLRQGWELTEQIAYHGRPGSLMRLALHQR